ncbi:hypothetical protein NQU47_06055 [Pseudoalteromonas distincta]|uniref:hypothetical protein n=1 Tax=Pseudoalteromonas distincta TaxID=77608 RepID=UPI00234126FE|nr:hypothetical protein [Pseudoalteromonas distincta]MDC3212127.1 hypothetical protein [Pseudoalteromonas distincta]
MKLFKKALLATAIFGAMGAHAADVTDAVQKTSVQGFEIGAVAASSVRVIVREQLEAGDIVYLKFGEGVDISGLTLTDAPGTSDVVIGGDVTIKYGSGTFTLSSNAAESDLANNILAIEVNTGDPVVLDSSFEVEITNTALVTKAKAAQATVTYSAKSGLTGAAKDTTGKNTGSFYVFADQYTSSVKTAFNGVIERVDQVTFEKNGNFPTAGTAPFDAVATSDGILFTVKDNGSSLLSPVGAAVPSVVATISGSFKDYTAADLLTAGEAKVTTTAGVDITGATVVVDTAGDLVVTLPAAALTDFNVYLTAPTGKKLPVTDFTADVEIVFGGAKPFAAASSVDAGKWILDATVINIPYFPVGFEGVSTSVHFANENKADADVIVTAIGESGEELTAVLELADLAGDTVTKVGQKAIMDAFGITTPTKLSVTFNINADSGTINAYAFSNTGTGRQALVTSQQTK